LTEEQGGNVDWDRFLALAGREYVERVKRWGEITGLTNREVGLEVNEYFTTSILVTEWVSPQSSDSLTAFERIWGYKVIVLILS